jgi:hypothetical protein
LWILNIEFFFYSEDEMGNRKIPTPEEVKEDLDEGEMSETIACELLDQLLGENTLRAVADGSISTKLLPHMLGEEDWDVIAYTSFISFDARTSNLFEIMSAELVDSLFGLAQFFRFCGMEITSTWATDMHCFGLSEEIGELSDQEYGACIAQSARTMGMTDGEIFALLDYLHSDDERAIQ